MSKKRTPRTIAIDFDGVLHRYAGYKGGKIDGPIKGARAAVAQLLAAGHTVVVFTTRDQGTVQRWLAEHGFAQGLEVTNMKRPFWLILDDRAMAFDGNWDGVVERIAAFKPYWHGDRPAEADEEMATVEDVGCCLSCGKQTNCTFRIVGKSPKRFKHLAFRLCYSCADARYVLRSWPDASSLSLQQINKE